jgi:imidazole glycerol-phosphate synthase subunit HisH
VLTAIDIRVSNLESVLQGFKRVGARVAVTDDPDDLRNAHTVVLPGVGAFGDGMARLHELRLVEPLRAHVAAGKPLLGICLGMQLLASSGDEHGPSEGLGVVPGRVVRLTPKDPQLRVPNMGWSDVAVARPGLLPLDGESYYFAHSYHLMPDDPKDIMATLDYGGAVVAAVVRGSAYGMQFHPEKSQDAGLDALAAFVRLADSA